jgi:DNA-directed RNA polymerase specialized sigma24 family protein
VLVLRKREGAVGACRDDAAVARVYGAAMAAAAHSRAASDATFRVFAAAGLRGVAADARAAAAVRLVLRAAPCAAFARMEPGDREAVALARLLGWREGQIGETLGTEVAEVRRRMVRGLRAGVACPV